jgi:hypothetical protein
MIRFRTLIAASPLLAIAAGHAGAQTLAMSKTNAAAPATVMKYGAATALGEGEARVYVETDRRTGAPVEIGVAFSARAMDGLPAKGTGHHGGHEMPHTFLLDLPAGAAPFTFLELNWNPSGHEPEGVYAGVPHFDFHFYTVSKAERESIDPKNPQYAEKANDVPTGDYVPQFNAALGPPGAKPADLAVPMMGVHWVDVRSAELQNLLGKPEAFKPFTATFIHGSWGGRFHFWEPMVTRAHIVAKKDATDPAVRDEIIPIPTPKKYHVPGWYPTAYRITWDGAKQEYRVALTQLVKRD